MTKKTLITSIILGAAVGGISLILIKPGVSKIMNLRKEIQSKQVDLAKVDEFFKDFNALKSQYSAHQKDLETLDEVLPPKPDIPGILVQMETLASENGLVVKTLDYSLPTSKDNQEYQKVAVRMELAGKYESFKSFLKALENNLRLMDISDISLSVQIETGETRIISYTYTLGLDTYYQKNAQD